MTIILFLLELYNSKLLSVNYKSSEGLTPIITFVSVLIIGVIIAVYVVDDESMRLPIILGSFFIGIFLAVLELRAIIGKNRIKEMSVNKNKDGLEEREKRLAKAVADLFEEDFDNELEE